MSILKSDEELKYKYRAKKVKGKRIDMQRYVMEQILGRKLTKNEIVHHIDGNKLNNDPSNLQVMTKAEHTRLHMNKGDIHKISKMEQSDAWKRGCYDSLKKRICAYDKTTKELVKEYDSICAVEEDGHAKRHVRECLYKIRKTHHGFIWRFKDELNKEEGVVLL